MKKLSPLLALVFFACAPMINDVTTTPDAPPRFRSALPDYPPRNAALQRKGYPDLKPLARAEPPAKAYEAALAAARRMPRWNVVAEDAKAFVIEAVATTRLMRFKDDVVIEVRPEPAGSSVHVRSKSREGKGDFGANAARIRAYLRELSR
jgi:uncharacterized protein (DUF1499 family)